MLLLFLIITHCAAAAPNYPPIDIDSKVIRSAPDSANTRTVWSLIWSCLSIIFSCTWVAIHPNVPAPEDSDWIIFKRKVGIFLIAVIAPECVILCALRQHLNARNYRDEYNRTVVKGTGSDWTLTHGFFMVMGGFVYQDEGGSLRFPILPRKEVSSESGIIPSINMTDFDFANINNTQSTILENQIKDRSKGDALSKLIVLFQLAWFTTQVIARAVEGLPITTLEVSTAAYVLLSMVLYGIWWHKPKDVRYPVGVKLLDPSANSPERYDRQITPIPVRPSFWDDFGAVIAGSEYDELDLTLVRRVPTFFSGDLMGSGNDACLRTELFLGSIFGAIHCAAWSFSFASHIEQVMWQTACVVATSVPLLPLFSVEVGERQDHQVLETVLELLVWIFFLVGLPTYVIGRVLLIAVTFSSLRSLPEGALWVVEWTTIIPHIG